MAKRMLGLAIILLAILVPLLVFGLKTVERGEIGVKTRLFPITGTKGIAEESLKPGMWLILPFLERIDIFSGRMQKLELTAIPDQGDRTRSDSVYIQTSDGTAIYVDATLLYRVVPEGAPGLLATLGHDYRERKVRPEFIAVLKARLGELSAEAFYNVEQRIAQAEAAREEFNNRMAENGIEAVHVLIRDYQYRKEFENAIQQRKLADQLTLMNMSRATASEQASELARIEARAVAMAGVEVQRGKSEAEKIKADARKYLALKKAEGVQLVETARAEGDALIEQALAGAGGRRAAALEMVEVLKGLDRIVVQSGGENGVNPLSLPQLLKLTGVDQ